MTTVLLWDPYSLAGGGNEVQRNFRAVLREVFADGSITILSAKSKASGSNVYASRLRTVFNFVMHSRVKYDLVVVQGIIDPSALLLALYCLFTRVPYIIVPRGDFIPTLRYFSITPRAHIKLLEWIFIGRWVVRSAVCLVTTSEMERDRIKRVFGRVSHSRIVPDPFCDRHTLITKSLMPQPSETYPAYALWLGRISPEKGLDLLLDSWALVVKQVPGAKLRIAGSTTDLSVMRKFLCAIQDLDLLGSVELLGWISGEEKEMQIRNARCVLLTSHYESYGLTVAEALIARTPVLVSTGTPWNVDGSKVCQKLDRTPESWALAVVELLKRSKKALVPTEIVRAQLESSTTERVADAWRSIRADIGFGGGEQYPALARKQSA